MRKTTRAFAFRLTLLSIACCAGVFSAVHADAVNNSLSNGISPPQQAIVDLSCQDGSLFRFSSGTDTGHCTVAKNRADATCTDGAATYAFATALAVSLAAPQDRALVSAEAMGEKNVYKEFSNCKALTRKASRHGRDASL